MFSACHLCQSGAPLAATLRMVGSDSPVPRMALALHSDAIYAEIIVGQDGSSCAHPLSSARRVTQPAGAHPAARPRRIVGLRMILRLVAALTLAAKLTVSLCVAFASLDSFLLRAYQTIAVATSCPRNAIQICSLACMAAHGLPTASVPMAGGTAQHLLQFLSHCIC